MRRRQGQFPGAIAAYRRSAELNPRTYNAWFNLGETLLFIRQYDLAEPFLKRATELAPDFSEGYIQQIRLALNARGDTQGASQVLRRAEERIPPAGWRSSWFDYARIIHSANLQDYVSRLGPSVYGLDSATYHFSKARFLVQLARRNEATIQFDSARIVLERMRNERPDQAWIHAILGATYAGLNRPDDALRSARRAVQLLPVGGDALDGPEMLINLANVYVVLGNADSAAVYFDHAVAIPSWASVNEMRVDPLLGSFTRTPQFQRLAKKWPNGGVRVPLPATDARDGRSSAGQDNHSAPVQISLAPTRQLLRDRDGVGR